MSYKKSIYIESFKKFKKLELNLNKDRNIGITIYILSDINNV